MGAGCDEIAFTGKERGEGSFRGRRAWAALGHMGS